MLAAKLPIFPLPNAVLFPGVSLPLHVFEHRYRALVADALRSDRMIGIVLLQPGWESHYEGRPAVYPIGCAGVITHAERLSDGRYNIVVNGLEKFRITGEDSHRPYRIAHTETLVEATADQDRQLVQLARARLEALLTPLSEGLSAEIKIPAGMSDADLVNGLAQYLELEPLERQALLEREGLLARCRSLVELLEMKALAAQGRWETGAVH